MGARVYLILDTRAVAKARIAKGMRVIDVAAAAGIGRSTAFLALRTGRCGLGVGRKIASALNVDVGTLWIDAKTGRPWRAIE